MSSKLSRSAYELLVSGNIEWLEAQPRTLERDHIREIVRESVRYYYEDAQDEAITNARLNALRPLEPHEREQIVHAYHAAGGSFLDAVNRILECRQGHP